MAGIRLENHNGSIRIKIQIEGRRYSITPVRKGKYENSADLAQATAVARLIEADINANCFDTTLARYRPHSSSDIQRLKANNLRDRQSLEAHSSPDSKVKVRELWDKYVEYKITEGISLSTLNIDYKRRVRNNLDKMPNVTLGDAIKVRDWLLKYTTPNQSKKILTQLSACCDWAIDSRLIKENPFRGMAGKIKNTQTKSHDEEDINPFTANERDIIISAFKTSYYYAHYYYLTKFIFYTGCRPSEAIALTWQDVRSEVIIFNKSFVEGNYQDRLKTQRQRTIKLNNQVLSLIKEVRDHHEKVQLPNLYQLLFPSPKGGYIDWHNFSNRAWKKTLASLPNIEYRNPYQMRHTYITLVVQSGVPIPDIAKHCGNSPKIILERYAGINRDYMPPEV